jgi:DNA-binding PadR family transcriptional regulator
MERQLLILGLLLNENMHGYQLNEHIEHTLGFYTDLKKPTLYYTLDKLEKQGYVRAQIEQEGNRPERRVYEVTEAGRAHFLDLLRRTLGDFARTTYGDDIAVMFMDQLPAAERRHLLSEKHQKTQVALDHLRDLPPHGGSVQHVIAHHIIHLEAEIHWLDGILHELSESLRLAQPFSNEGDSIS